MGHAQIKKINLVVQVLVVRNFYQKECIMFFLKIQTNKQNKHILNDFLSLSLLTAINHVSG